jgi:hypothetical protein
MTLGCDADYRASVVDAGGAVVVNLEVITKLEFFRLINDSSTASVTSTFDPDCCAQVGDVRSWRHWLVIYRNADFMWAGPILTCEWSQGQVEIMASDITSIMARRVPHTARSFAGADTMDVAHFLINDAFNVADPPYTIETPDGARGAVATVDYEIGFGQTLDHLKTLTENNGIDFTAVGSTIYLLPDAWESPVGALTDADFPQGLNVAEDGTAFATRWVVFGSDDSGAMGEAGGPHPFYGLVERFVQDTSITTNEAATIAARSRLNTSLPLPLYIDTQDVTLSSDSAVNLATLIPGWTLDVSTVTTCRDVTERLKIIGLDVSADENGESIKVQVGPLTTGMEAA